jgi:HDOD domain
LPIDIPDGEQVRNERVFEIGVARNVVSAGQASHFDLIRDLPDVPVMTETLLLMELMVRERTVDLSGISQLVLGDLGAAIQVLRLAGREDASMESFPTRIEDCISGLGLDACLEAMSRRTIKRSSRPREMMGAWAHARTAAENCRILAEEGSFLMNPEEAYLVGLFHTIGSLPAVLGWTMPLAGGPDAVGLRLAQAWSLPRCVIEYFTPLRSIAGVNRWREIVRQAHRESACSLSEEVVYEQSIGSLAHAISS